MVTSEMAKKTTVISRMRPKDQSRPNLTSPLTSARLRLTTGVSGAIQLSVCTSGGKEDRGKNTPLKKNIGVTTRVKK